MQAGKWGFSDTSTALRQEAAILEPMVEDVEPAEKCMDQGPGDVVIDFPAQQGRKDSANAAKNAAATAAAALFMPISHFVSLPVSGPCAQIIPASFSVTWESYGAWTSILLCLDRRPAASTISSRLLSQIGNRPGRAALSRPGSCTDRSRSGFDKSVTRVVTPLFSFKRECCAFSETSRPFCERELWCSGAAF